MTPNPRVQGMRSTSPPSPLSRQPLGRAGSAAAIALCLGTATIAKGVSLSVSIREQSNTIAVVVARNPSGQAVSLNLVPSFEMSPCGSSSGDAFWAPFSFDPLHRRLPANARSTLSIPAGGEVKDQIDLASLGWDRVISAEWPSRGFRDVVKPGCYRLVVTGDVKDGKRLKSTRWRMILK